MIDQVSLNSDTYSTGSSRESSRVQFFSSEYLPELSSRPGMDLQRELAAAGFPWVDEDGSKMTAVAVMSRHGMAMVAGEDFPVCSSGSSRVYCPHGIHRLPLSRC